MENLAAWDLKSVDAFEDDLVKYVSQVFDNGASSIRRAVLDVLCNLQNADDQAISQRVMMLDNGDSPDKLLFGGLLLAFSAKPIAEHAGRYESGRKLLIKSYEVRKQAMSLLLLGLLNDVGPGKCHTGSFDGQIARSCYEECGQLGLKLGWVFLNEFDEEHGIGGSTTEDRVVEKNGTNFKTPHESGSVDSVTTSFPDLRTTAIASSTPVLSEEQDMAQLLPKCMEEDLKGAPKMVSSASQFHSGGRMLEPSGKLGVSALTNADPSVLGINVSSVAAGVNAPASQLLPTVTSGPLFAGVNGEALRDGLLHAPSPQAGASPSPRRPTEGQTLTVNFNKGPGSKSLPPEIYEMLAPRLNLPDAAAVEKYVSNFELLYGREETSKMIRGHLQPHSEAAQESLLAGVHSQATIAGLQQAQNRNNEAFLQQLMLQRQGMARGQAPNGPYVNGFQQFLGGNNLAQNGNLAALGLLLNGNNTPREGRGMAPRNDLLNGYNGFAQKQGQAGVGMLGQAEFHQLLLRKPELAAALRRNPEGVTSLSANQLAQLALLENHNSALKTVALQEQMLRNQLSDKNAATLRMQLDLLRHRQVQQAHQQRVAASALGVVGAQTSAAARQQGFTNLGGQGGQERLRPGMRSAGFGGLSAAGLPLAGVNGVLPGRSSGHLAHQLNIQQGRRPDQF